MQHCAQYGGSRTPICIARMRTPQQNSVFEGKTKRTANAQNFSVALCSLASPKKDKATIQKIVSHCQQWDIGQLFTFLCLGANRPRCLHAFKKLRVKGHSLPMPVFGVCCVKFLRRMKVKQSVYWRGSHKSEAIKDLSESRFPGFDSKMC